MGNEMGNRNVSGLQEEEKSGVEETDKYLVGDARGDEFKGENHVVPDVKDKDFHENVDGFSGGDVFGDGDCNAEKQIADEKGQDDDSHELKLSSQSVEMEVPKELDNAATQANGTVEISSSKLAVVDHDDNPILNSDFDGDKLILDQISIERETDEIEMKGATFDSTSSSKYVHNVQVKPLVEASSVVYNTNDQVVEKKMEELFLEEEYLGGSQEEKCEVGSVGDEGNGVPVIGSADSSQEVCERQGKHVGFTQEPKLLVKDTAQEENCEVATADEDVNGFPLVGSLDSSQEVEMEVPKESDDAATQANGTVEISSSKQAVVDHDNNPILNTNFNGDKLILDQITIERETDEIKTKGATFDSTSSSKYVHNVQVEPLVEASSVVSNTNDQVVEKKMEELFLEEEYLRGSQEKKCEVGSVGDEGNGVPVIGSADSSQKVCEPQGKHVGVTQEPKLLVKDAAQEENCEVATADEDGNGFPLVGSLDSSQEVSKPLDKSIGLAQETELLAKDGDSAEDKCEVANVGDGGNGFPLVGSIGSAHDRLMDFTQDPESLVKENAAQEEKREVANVDEDVNAFPPVGSLDSSQEVCEPQDKSMFLPQETELMAKDRAFQEAKCEVPSLDEGNEIILFGSINSSEEISEPQDKSMELRQETKLVVMGTASQEGKCDITRVNADGNGFPLVGPLLSSQEVCEQQDNSIGRTEETKLIVKDSESQKGNSKVGSLDEEGNGFPLFGSANPSQELSETQDKSMGQEGKCEIGSVVEQRNGFPLFGSADSSQELSETQDKSMGQEGKCEIGSVAEEGNGFLLFGSVNSSQEVSEPQDESMGLHHQEVTVLVRELLTVPTELTVTDENHQENKSTEEMEEKKEDSNAMGNERSRKETTEQHIPLSNSTEQEKDFLSPSPPDSQLHEGSTITSLGGEKITNKNPGNIVERKCPSFDFDLSLGARLSQESDRTPLLVHDKAATRSLSSRENLISQKNLRQTYQYSKVPLEDEAVSVEEKTIMMERSYSMKLKAPLMNLLKKEEQKEEGNVGYKKADKEVVLTSVKGSNGKRKPMSSFFATCICCDTQII